MVLPCPVTLEIRNLVIAITGDKSVMDTNPKSFMHGTKNKWLTLSAILIISAMTFLRLSTRPSQLDHVPEPNPTRAFAMYLLSSWDHMI